MTIEKNIKKLDSLISQLDSDDIHIEKSVALYGEIIKIASESADQLKTLNTQIIELKKQGDSVIESLS